MGLSLSQSSRKSRIGNDPRNTQWANDTERFGHQQLLRMGWKPGRGLGSTVEGTKEHIKVNVKTDAKGLGHQNGQADQPTGLDVFQRILGKLNGNEQEVEEQIQKKERSGLYLQFVPGGVLEGTVKSTKEMKRERKSAEKERKKIEQKAERRAAKLAKKERKAKKSKSQSSSSPESSTSAESEPSSASVSISASTSASISASPVPTTARPSQARGIRATRNRYIAMKRQATADAKGLKEILMQ